MFLLWSQAEQGPTEGQDGLLGPEGILGHLQPVGPMSRQPAEARGGALFMFLQLSKSVLKLTEHVQPKKHRWDIFYFDNYKLLQTEKKNSSHKPDNILVSSLVGPALVAGGGQRDDLLLPHQLQLVIESLTILLLR